MAKTLDNATKLQQKLNWLRTEYETLPELYREKKNKDLADFTRKANKKLLPAAFAACDKEQYAACQMAEKLQRFDSKQYLAYRQAHHKAAKAIFAAQAAGQDWQAALDTMEAERLRIKEKRNACIRKLEEEKKAFLAKHSASDSGAYDTLKQQMQTQQEQLSADLDQTYARQLAQKQAALQKKMDRLARQIADAKPTGNKYQLPEDVILSVRGLKMYFGGLKAVDDLDFDVHKGEIFGLIGPNGAGKTTVFNCITQFYKPTGGQLLFKTREGEHISLTDYPVHDIILKGIARTFQNLEVVKEVSVLENLLIAATRQYTSSLLTQMLHLPQLGREERAIRAKADRILKYMDLYDYRNRLAWGLPYGVLKRLEIARALMCNPQLIILDEPAAGLNESETADLAALIQRIRSDFDCTILLVEHDMSLVMNVCDHICAISFGKKLAYGTAAEIQASREVQEAYLGTGGE